MLEFYKNIIVELEKVLPFPNRTLPLARAIGYPYGGLFVFRALSSLTFLNCFVFLVFESFLSFFLSFGIKEHFRILASPVCERRISFHRNAVILF